jgi:hypothetical protein
VLKQKSFKKSFKKSLKNGFILVLAFGFGFLSIKGQAEVDNQFFHTSKSPFLSGPGVYFGFDSLGYFRNKEYFNAIADGYTLLGAQAHSWLAYQPGESFRVDLGVHALHDFGTTSFRQVLPTFSFTYFFSNSRLIFGALDGALSHRLIEPLFNFENLIDRRHETGLQYRVEMERVFTDVWIDWRNMIYAGDAEQEEFLVGFSFLYHALAKSRWSVALPLQVTGFHEGGQIGTTDLSAYTVYNAALGAQMTWKVSESGLMENLVFAPYWLGFSKQGRHEATPLERGSGWYLNLSTQLSFLGVSFAYWKGNQFHSPVGGFLYRSISSRWDKNVVEKDRELFILRFFKDFQLQDGLGLSLRLQPYLDRALGRWEHSAGLYFTYHPNFLLFVPKAL